MSETQGEARFPLKTLLDTLRSLSAGTAPLEPWGNATAAEARTAIGSFFQALETMSIQQVESTWRDAFAAVLEVYKQTGSPEAAMLAQNFVGFILWRTSVRWDKMSWKDDSRRLRRLAAEMTGEEAIAWLTRNGLRRSCPFGPSVLWPLISEWLTIFEEIATDAFDYTSEGLLSGRQPAPNALELPASLTQTRFKLIYDFPFVQEGIRLISIAVGWITPFVIMSRCTTNRAFTPLTRILFTLALVDQYFKSPRSPHPSQLKDLFAEDASALGSRELISAVEANNMKRTAYDVRASAAIAYGDPYVYAVQPGMVAEKLRNGPDIILADHALTEDALAIHMSAVVRLITDGDLNDGGGALDAAKAKLSESARRAWGAVQHSSSPRQLLEALIERGFVRQACRVYESALKANLGKTRGTVNELDTFDDVQQVIGCIAVIGNIVFGLMESYGPGMTYLTNYMDNGLPPDADSDFIKVLGLDSAIIAQILGRCIPPNPHEDYVKSARAILAAEMDSAIRQSGAGTANRAIQFAKESLMLWFDSRAEHIWGIVPPEELIGGEPSEHLASVDHSDLESISGPNAVDPDLESRMIRLAMTIRYPESMPITPESTTPHFLRYILATVCVDALSAITTSVFSERPINTVIEILTWARDYGAPYIGSFVNHRNKLNALISSLAPFARDLTAKPTTDDAYNLEMLMGELYDVVYAAVQMVPPETRPIMPPRPEISNSLLLISMHGTALGLQFNYLADRTLKCAAYLAERSRQLVKFAYIFKHFFACKFAAGTAGGTVTVYRRGEPRANFGTWKIVDVLSALREFYDSSGDVMANVRLKSMVLRTLIEETGKQVHTCDNLMERAILFSVKAASYFSTLGTDYARLARLQNSLDLHVRALTSCSTPPGTGDIVWLLDKWQTLSEINSTFRDRSSQDLASAIENVGVVWQKIADRIEVPRDMEDRVTNDEIDAAVATLLGRLPVVTDDSPALVVELTSRHNLTHRDELNFDTLDLDTVAHDDVDLANFAKDFLIKPRVTVDGLVDIVDTVFNNERQARDRNA
ncbi:UL37 protein [Gallid alphaherpesvirus 3]|uniref:UL37 protein n=1 Tax=Gallid alphaherpesvirus 3 TaxID=35250 RepID=F8TC33_9ALPH|nr:UL37 protein [Gallid alphaherpesvirus 3]AEI00244.1 UL37 protein [Gallid alphaherpesvirus 3]QEY02217.1 UL37 protein [Gallid alphaherpesvirus 3]